MSSQFPLSVLPADSPSEYASLEEVRRAVEDMSGPEAKKLLLVAGLHCRTFRLPPSHLEPGELLNEAVRRTLNGRKRWRKGVKFLHHLHRAMENIAGHEVVKLGRRHELSGGQEEEPDDPLDALQTPRNADQTVVAQVLAREDLEGLVKLFSDDPNAWNVLLCRAAGREREEILSRLKLSDTEYETISKRILRKTNQYYEPKFRARRHRHAA